MKDPKCPCCGRLLPIAGLRSGKVGCRQCRSIFFWDRATGQLTPLQSAKKRKFLTLAIISIVALACIGSAIIFHLQPARVPGPPDAAAIIDEASRHLKSLAE